MKRTIIIAVASAFALVASACGAGKTAAPAATTTLAASLTEYAIEVTPPVAAPDTAVEVAVRNDGKEVHQLAVDIGGQTLMSPILQAGQHGTLSLPSLPAGAYKFWCSIGSHEAAGMTSRLIVGTPGSSSTHVASMSPQEMEAMEEAAVKAFPAKTKGVGGRLLQPIVIGGEKTFRLTVAPVRWEVSPGEFVDAYAYNGQIPGPELRVRKGDRIAVAVQNRLPESTTVHFHGLEVPNSMDGVPFITQPPIRSGEVFTYRFTVVDGPGTYMYHSHENATVQVGKGLLGSLVVEEPNPSWDVEQTMVLGDGELGYTLNGKGFPATAPILASRNEDVLVRFMNQGQQLHPMHLHGFHFNVVARDGRPVKVPYAVDTLVVAPGERYDITFKATLPGVWAFHCHILPHVESSHGMFGMVTAVIVS